MIIEPVKVNVAELYEKRSNRLIGTFNKLYDTSKDFIEVKFKDIPHTSKEIEVNVKCDFCGDIYTTTIYNIHRLHEKAKKEGTSEKDCCGKKECKIAKIFESNKMKFGSAIPRKREVLIVEINGKEIESFRCIQCEKVKALRYFSKDKKSSTGHGSTCKACVNKNMKTNPTIKAKQKEYYEAHKDEIKEYKKNWFQNRKVKKD